MQAQKEQRFVYLNGARDLFWAVLFITHLLAVLVICVYGYIQYKDNINIESGPLDEKAAKISLILLGCGVFALVLAIIWKFLLRVFTKYVVWGTLIFSVLMLLAIGVALFIFSNVIWFIFFGVVPALIYILLFFLWRKRIPFATVMLTTVTDVTKRYPATTLISFVSVLVQAIWISIWVSTVVFIILWLLPNGSTISFIQFFLLVSLYWTSQVIGNIVHATCAGTFATWYFLGGTNAMQDNPTLKSFKRATTTSFGSICLGSLIIAIIQALRSSNSSRNRNGYAGCCLGCLENLIKYFTRYAFVQVAVYGKTFCQAAKDTWHLMTQRGIDAIVNDSIINKVLGTITLISAVLCGVLGGVAGFLDADLNNPMYIAILAFSGFLIGIILVNQAFFVIDSGVATIFVCFCEDPQSLNNTKPDLYQILKENFALRENLLS